MMIWRQHFPRSESTLNKCVPSTWYQGPRMGSLMVGVYTYLCHMLVVVLPRNHKVAKNPSVLKV